MNKKKEQEREELHKTIWKIATDLRGSVDGWDFKQYVLGLLFYRFISENLVSYINGGEVAAGTVDFDYAKISDEEAEFGREETLAEKGFYILPSELFENVRKNAEKDNNLNVRINKIFSNIENSAKGTDSEGSMKGLFDDFDVKGNKLGNTVSEKNKKLVKLLDAIGDLNLGNYKDNSIDTFGDAYEFLMTMYASHAGKSGGEFFTPQEVGDLLARITLIGKTKIDKVYDPACGSGSLLLKFVKVLGKKNIKKGIYGQELNLTTFNLCRINMFLHDINYNEFNIARGDTLLNPAFRDQAPFDAIVSNPPYSIHWIGKADPLLINDDRFAPAGILAPQSKADLAFTMHILSYLAPEGTASIVEFPGVLYRTGIEQKIREYLIKNNFVDTIIQLPVNMFFGTGMPTCVIVLKKNKKDSNVLFINAKKEFVKNGNKNKLAEINIDKIIDLIKKRDDIKDESILVDNQEIANNKYIMAVDSYLKTESSQAIVDISTHNENLRKIVERQTAIREEIDKIIADLEGSWND